MAPNPYELYAIGAGYNVAAISLTNIETIKPTNDFMYIQAPQAINFYDPGTRKIRGDGTVQDVGFAMVDWQEDIFTVLALDKFRTDYCNGGWSGKVTINTRLGGRTYFRMNAIMILPKPVDSGYQPLRYEPYIIKFARLVASS